MAGMINDSRRRFLSVWLKCAAAATPLGITACASTEELYAKYDEQACVFVVEKGPGTTLTLREEVSKLVYAWEPAVYFAYDSAELDEQSKKLLDTSLPILKQFPQLRLGLQGFTDSLGGFAYNLRLANRRIKSVQAYLTSNDIDPDRMSSQPIGKGLPEFGDDLVRAQASNRRVELMLLDELGRPLHPSFSFDD